MIAFLRDEPGAEVVASVLSDSDSTCYAHSLNLCEVFYDFHRASGQADALKAVKDLLRVGIIEDSRMSSANWQAAGVLKSTLRRVSLVDCFAIELTQRVEGTLLTADHHEFDTLARKKVCAIQFIR